VARQLLVRYGRKDPKTGQPTGRSLSRDELGLTQTAFRQLDMDGNGSLDLEELGRFHNRDADIELIVRIGRTGKDEPYLERFGKGGVRGKSGQLQRNVDGSFSLEQGPDRLVVHRLDDEPDRIAVRRLQLNYKAMFLQADQDKNGYLDAQEAQRSPFFGSVFAMMDRDHDGKLFEKEMVAYLDQISKMQQLAQTCCVSLHVSDQGQGLFKQADSNEDGRLGLRELRQMSQLVERLDRDGDGKIAPNELPHTYRLDLSRGPSMQPRTVQRVRARFQPGGYFQPPAPAGRAGPVWFVKMDRNGDGDISRREFLGTEEQFRQLDSDGDGLISLDEARTADAALRKK
jgi:Ca2+-binding EF-hand superfamily protein